MIAHLGNIALTALFSLAALFVLSKLMGSKQISQMTMFDYAIGISIGSIAAEMATGLEDPLGPLVAMSVYALMDFVISKISEKSMRARRLLTGAPLLLISTGKLCRQNFKKARLELNEFLMLCRQAGYFDLGQIHTAIFEHSGSVSILPVSAQRAANPSDLGIKPQQEQMPLPFVIDGRIAENSLKSAGLDSLWLEEQLRKQGYRSVESVFFADFDCSGNLRIFPEQKEE